MCDAIGLRGRTGGHPISIAASTENGDPTQATPQQSAPKTNPNVHHSRGHLWARQGVLERPQQLALLEILLLILFGVLPPYS